MTTRALFKSRKLISTVKTPIIGALIAAVVALGTTSIASAAPYQAEPIQIQNVHIVSRASTDKSSVPVSAQIAFANTSSVPATEVVFAVESNGALVESFDDIGSFATGTTIVHNFPYNDFSGSPRVAVAKVVFADGSVWINPAYSNESPSTTTSASEAR